MQSKCSLEALLPEQECNANGIADGITSPAADVSQALDQALFRGKVWRKFADVAFTRLRHYLFIVESSRCRSTRMIYCKVIYVNVEHWDIFSTGGKVWITG
eukprot:Plantae.Rhodophyta-Hildenbrandia_rubra.ctg36600.p1 GENE.Plantae.Rhodophyta-Hildenbrandia_rubra.ctg36600~~Plantae.Rhodophyta-Hildenbrandia_rubra.ctg36600.p1  ORF type:complete len:101 (+),score=6.48 Plantae.Rhodophyta-Hildenbrandia_rubra.ctg36600:273-575(+)